MVPRYVVPNLLPVALGGQPQRPLRPAHPHHAVLAHAVYAREVLAQTDRLRHATGQVSVSEHRLGGFAQLRVCRLLHHAGRDLECAAQGHRQRASEGASAGHCEVYGAQFCAEERHAACAVCAICLCAGRYELRPHPYQCYGAGRVYVPDVLVIVAAALQESAQVKVGAAHGRQHSPAAHQQTQGYAVVLPAHKTLRSVYGI
mmetsp:Transcript_19501/g.43452  ORF Transcript_19501/g.43452 Transcript_19501/m.43452 type:complete len:202 (+) Transcript_19501:2378-2983(+)